jgi:flagellar biosynthesis chaperone FliJ
MTTFFEITTQFEMQKLIELNSLTDRFESYLEQLDYLNENYDDLDIIDLNNMSDLECRDIPNVQNQIDNINAVFDCIQHTKKMKVELVEKSLQMMYHPKRVARLLYADLITFYDESFQEL